MGRREDISVKNKLLFLSIVNRESFSYLVHGSIRCMSDLFSFKRKRKIEKPTTTCQQTNFLIRFPTDKMLL